MTELACDSKSLTRFYPVLALLAACMFINYIDRGNLSVAAPLLKQELGLSASQLGLLLSGFFWTYTAMQFVSGWLVDRFSVNRLIAAGYLVWSLSTAITGWVHGFVLLLAMRLVLGVGESVALPSCGKILARHLPERHRGFANGVIAFAFRGGNAVGTLFAGLAMARYGWRPVFIVVGFASLLWLPAWARWRPRGEKASSTVSNASYGVREILAKRSFWGSCAGHFCSNYLLYFMVTWLPYYLVHARHLSMQTMSRTAGLYYLVDALSAVVGGWLSDQWIYRGGDATLVRKTTSIVGFAIAAVAMGGLSLASSGHYVWWLVAAGMGCGTTAPGNFALPQSLAGPQAAGRWTGLQNGFANLAGILGPALTGFVVERTGSFLVPFAITAALCGLGGLAWLFVVGRVEEVQWGLISGASN
jgi:ACS family D-galactonate transporter-like MFS transporter